MGTAKVGSHARGAGRGRVQDLAGNVWEWTSDREVTHRDADGTVQRGGFGLGGPDPGPRVIRGGGFMTDMDEELRVSARALRSVKDRRADLGFRCAYDP